MTKNELSMYMDHTNLKAYAAQEDIKKLCNEVMENGFACAMVNPCYVKFCAEYMKNRGNVGTVTGFPLGANTTESKVFESVNAIENGAKEIDYVVNIGRVKNKDYLYIENEMKEITKACHDRGAVVKVIFENCYLEQSEIKKLSEIAKIIKPEYIKTSTGFGTYGARIQDVILMKEAVGEDVKVKAAGGIRNLKDCMEMIKAGADRSGTSNSVEILKERL